MMIMRHNMKLVLLAWYCGFWILTEVTSQDEPEPPQIYELVDWTVVTPQWLDMDLYDGSIHQPGIRYPHDSQRFGITLENRELVVLSEEGKELVPDCKGTLELGKKARRLLKFKDYKPVRFSGVNNYHVYAEKIKLRVRTFGYTDEMLIPALYLPTGWPLFLFLIFTGWIFFIPLLGAFLLEVAIILVRIYEYLLWGPVKRLLRMIVIRREKNTQRWVRFLAPPYFLKPRSTWKLPYLLRHGYIEDIPPELAYQPPINKIDYSLYTLTQDDFDEVDLEMDELEFIDEMLQFKEENPNAVARLLKHRLGVEKFYNYFDEDILSDEEGMDMPPPPPPKKSTKDGAAPKDDDADKDSDFAMDEQQEKALENDYLTILQVDDAWMHPDFDETFEGTAFELEEIRKRREILAETREEILYLHRLIENSKQYTKDLVDLPEDQKMKNQRKARKLLDRYLRYSRVTKGRVAEVEPSTTVQLKHNVHLSPYLPLISQMSHHNHRLNLRHDKMKDPDKRQIQLDVFGGP